MHLENNKYFYLKPLCFGCLCHNLSNFFFKFFFVENCNYSGGVDATVKGSVRWQFGNMLSDLFGSFKSRRGLVNVA